MADDLNKEQLCTAIDELVARYKHSRDVQVVRATLTLHALTEAIRAGNEYLDRLTLDVEASAERRLIEQERKSQR